MDTTSHSPLSQLIHRRMGQLGLSPQVLGIRLGYRNPAKAAGRVQALCDGNLARRKNQAALARLPDALEISPEVLERAVADTRAWQATVIANAEIENQRVRELENAEWRARFRPHAVIQTERKRPTQITICALTGGIERWLIIPLDESKPAISYIGQALARLPERGLVGSDGRRRIPFFGEVMGIAVNYSPDQATLFNLAGEPIEVLSGAWRPGILSLSVGPRTVAPETIARMIGVE